MPLMLLQLISVHSQHWGRSIWNILSIATTKQILNIVQDLPEINLDRPQVQKTTTELPNLELQHRLDRPSLNLDRPVRPLVVHNTLNLDRPVRLPVAHTTLNLGLVATTFIIILRHMPQAIYLITPT